MHTTSYREVFFATGGGGEGQRNSIPARLFIINVAIRNCLPSENTNFCKPHENEVLQAPRHRHDFKYFVTQKAYGKWERGGGEG